MTSSVDVLIIGGGPAGLACADCLARQLHTAVVFSHRRFRDDKASRQRSLAHCWGYHHHNHRAPSELRKRAAEDIASRYGDAVAFEDVEDRSVRKLGSGRFEAIDTDGQRYSGRRVLIASGIRDLLPSIPGYRELWGRAIFHCLFCNGYEKKGSPSAGLLAIGLLASAVHTPPTARMASRLAETIRVYTNEAGKELEKELRPFLKNPAKYKFVDTKIEKLEGTSDAAGGTMDVLVKLADGSVNREAFVVHSPYFELNGPFARDLGADITPEGHIDARFPFYSTAVPGVFAAGDCATAVRGVPQAIAMGNGAAAGLAHSLQAEDEAAG